MKHDPVLMAAAISFIVALIYGSKTVFGFFSEIGNTFADALGWPAKRVPVERFMIITIVSAVIGIGLVLYRFFF
jgi:hypothetical protein